MTMEQEYIDEVFRDVKPEFFSDEVHVRYLSDVNQVLVLTQTGQEISRIRLKDITDVLSIWAIGELIGHRILMRMRGALPSFAGSLKRIHSDKFGVATDLLQRALRLMPMYLDDNNDKAVAEFLGNTLTPEQKKACIEAWK